MRVRGLRGQMSVRQRVGDVARAVHSDERWAGRRDTGQAFSSTPYRLSAIVFAEVITA